MLFILFCLVHLCYANQDFTYDYDDISFTSQENQDFLQEKLSKFSPKPKIEITSYNFTVKSAEQIVVLPCPVSNGGNIVKIWRHGSDILSVGPVSFQVQKI